MKRLAKICEGEVKKIEYKDTAVGENIFRKITVPKNRGMKFRFKIRRLMKGFDNFDNIPRADPVKLITKNFEKVTAVSGAEDIIFFTGSTQYIQTLLPVILKRRGAVVCVPREIYHEVNDFFMDKAGAACVFLPKNLPCTAGKTAVFMPDAQGGELPEARLILDLCGGCSGSNVKRAEDIRITPPYQLLQTGATNAADVVTLAEYFGIECNNLQVF